VHQEQLAAGRVDRVDAVALGGDVDDVVRALTADRLIGHHERLRIHLVVERNRSGKAEASAAHAFGR
jgi:hypothetical protein